MHSAPARKPSMAVLTAIPALFLAACDMLEGPPQDRPRPFVASSNHIACGDWRAYVEDTSGYYVLEIRALEPDSVPDRYSVFLGAEQRLLPNADIALYRMDRKNAMADCFCGDVLPQARILDTLAGHGGEMTVHKYGRKPGIPSETFLLDVELRSVEFSGREGREFLMDSLRLDSLAAGWLPG